jgi:hypothetical protein
MLRPGRFGPSVALAAAKDLAVIGCAPTPNGSIPSGPSPATRPGVWRQQGAKLIAPRQVKLTIVKLTAGAASRSSATVRVAASHTR